MPTYVYETIPSKKGAKPKRYEIKQSIKEAALAKHPETGEPIKRIIAGGVGVLTSSPTAAHAHTPSCGCGAGGCRG
jgi:predicted nucleic acid-binding Zn ribbon protein